LGREIVMCARAPPAGKSQIPPTDRLPVEHGIGTLKGGIMRSRVTMLVIVLVALALPAAGQAQQEHERFWWGFGLGGGSDSWQWWEDGLRGAAGYFRLGGTVNAQVLFGGEAFVFWREGSGSGDLQRVNATAVALLYPSRNGGMFFKGGFGVARAELHGCEPEGIGTTFGTGIDLRIGKNAYVTPNLDLLVQFFEHDTNASLLFTLGITWH
jgi:hypothetical protein